MTTLYWVFMNHVFYKYNYAGTQLSFALLTKAMSPDHNIFFVHNLCPRYLRKYLYLQCAGRCQNLRVRTQTTNKAIKGYT